MGSANTHWPVTSKVYLIKISVKKKKRNHRLIGSGCKLEKKITLNFSPSVLRELIHCQRLFPHGTLMDFFVTLKCFTACYIVVEAFKGIQLGLFHCNHASP